MHNLTRLAFACRIRRKPAPYVCPPYGVRSFLVCVALGVAIALLALSYLPA